MQRATGASGAILKTIDTLRYTSLANRLGLERAPPPTVADLAPTRPKQHAVDFLIEGFEERMRYTCSGTALAYVGPSGEALTLEQALAVAQAASRDDKFIWQQVFVVPANARELAGVEFTLSDTADDRVIENMATTLKVRPSSGFRSGIPDPVFVPLHCGGGVACVLGC